VSFDTAANPLHGVRRVRVGSRNEPKLAAVRNALSAYAPDVDVEGVDVSSGVPDQPVGFDEIIRGAKNRAAAARASGACDLGVGIEDGLVAVAIGAAEVSGDHLNIGCAAVSDGRRTSIGFSSAFAYPPGVTEAAVRERAPIGALFDALWRERRRETDRRPSGETSGNVGKLTAGVLPRSEYARHAVLCALVAFVNPDLYTAMTTAEQADRPIADIDDLVELFRNAEKPPEQWRVGTEHEKIGLHADTLKPVPYEGDRGIGALLESIASVDDWVRIFEAGNLIALEKRGASITLEPGGQLELSGAPLRTIHETCDEFHTHLELMKRVCEPFGIVWLGLGIHPIDVVANIPAMPKARYGIMRRYLPTRGEQGLVMMFETATVQANFDYSSEPDMVEKMRLAIAVSPIVSAVYANSSLSEGRANGFISRRMDAWDDTDPDRTGLLPFVFEPDFGYRRYVEWALDVPMFFVVRDETYHPAAGMTFRTFLRDGFGDARATFADWNRHLTTLFPEVRLKNIIEVRGADAVPPGLTCSLPAIWKGLLYDARSRADAAALVAESTHAMRVAARADVARRGLAADYGGRPVLDLARQLAAISRDGLKRIAHAGATQPDETGFLDPVLAQLESGASPGQVILERWNGAWKKSLDRLIEYARY
jgi:glutamate--cysteine ligase